MRKLLVLLFLAAVPCLGDECGAPWGYTGDKGPAHWGNLDPAWKACSVGTRQSPIDLSDFGFRNNTMALLTFLGGDSTFRVENTGHELKVTVTEEWKLQRSGLAEAKLLQFHFHVPAEHYERGQQNAGEIHFVYQLPANRYLVLAVWIQQGTTANAALATILANKPQACRTSPVSSGKINIGQLLINPHHYATYDGSLTTPPCSENVTFIIELEGITATAEQIAALKILTGGNARPLQKREDRAIQWRQMP